MDCKMSPNPAHPVLDPSAQSALGVTSPQKAWDELRAMTEQAIENEYDQSQQLAEKMNLPVDLADLRENLAIMDPVRAINEFHYINQDFNLKRVLSNPPLEVLKAILRMEVESDRFQAPHNLD